MKINKVPVSSVDDKNIKFLNFIKTITYAKSDKKRNILKINIKNH